MYIPFFPRSTILRYIIMTIENRNFSMKNCNKKHTPVKPAKQYKIGSIMVLVAKLVSMMLILLPDIDECRLTTSPCSQLCSNSQGSYKCGCRRGYELVRGGLCRGKVTFSVLIFFMLILFIPILFMITLFMLTISCTPFHAHPVMLTISCTHFSCFLF